MISRWLLEPCPSPSGEHEAAASARQSQLTKPRGSLGVLEDVAIKLAALQRTDRPRADRVPVVLFAGDHGVAAQGVSAYPQEVTVQMLRNFAGGGAAICVLARELDAPLYVVDVGTLSETPIASIETDKSRRGTRDFSAERALTRDEVEFALAAGRRAVARVTGDRADLLILGEMGIGNTTSATAICAALLGRPADELVGSGTGLADDGIARKVEVIARALERHGLSGGATDAIEVLECVGGLEIAALAGAIVAAAQAQTPVLVDGFIVSAAALVAVRHNPSCRDWLLFSHRSAEQGHRIVLSALGAEPLLDLRLRLGEGSGAAVAVPLVRLACALHAEMATFEEAQVADRPT